MINVDELNEHYPGMTRLDALEYYSYNIEGSKGEGFPIYVRTKF